MPHLGPAKQVTCGSTIKLAHDSSKYRLHSQGIPYSRGSRQQSVTAFPLEHADSSSYWVVHGTKDKPCRPGFPVNKRQQLRLQHVASRKWLHSHTYQSPLSGNQEVSAFGADDRSDGGDVWTVEWDSKASHWKQDVKVRLRHEDTQTYLHSYKQASFGHPIAGQNEVCAVKKQGRESEWFAAEGIYLPRNDVARAKAASTAGGSKGDGGGAGAAASDKKPKESGKKSKKSKKQGGRGRADEL